MVSNAQVVRRGLTNRCPNCGEKTLFAAKSLRIRRRCTNCKTGFDRGEGFFLGPLVINYTVAVLFFVVPAIIAGARGAITWPVAATLAIFGCIVPPLVLYRLSWSWWLMLYFYTNPDRLPANGGPVGETEED